LEFQFKLERQKDVPLKFSWLNKFSHGRKQWIRVGCNIGFVSTLSLSSLQVMHICFLVFPNFPCFLLFLFIFMVFSLCSSILQVIHICLLMCFTLYQFTPIKLDFVIFKLYQCTPIKFDFVADNQTIYGLRKSNSIEHAHVQDVDYNPKKQHILVSITCRIML